MSEQFVKLHKWMATDLHLSGSELIVFAVIHSYTTYQGGYAGGAAALAEWCGISKSKIYPVLDKLIAAGHVVKVKASKGRSPSIYVSRFNCPERGQLEQEQGDSQQSPKGTVNCPHGGTLLDNRYIDTPYNPPKGDGANADAKTDKKRRRLIPRSQNYLQGKHYTEDELKKMGISLGEEFYEDDTLESVREELRT